MAQIEMQQAATALRENRINDAIALLQAVLIQSPDDFSANHMLGVALGKAGRGPESLAKLVRATQLNPGSAAAQTHLGMAYEAAGKPEMARQAFQAALRADASFAPAQTALAKLPAPPPKAAPVPIISGPVLPTPPKAATKADAKTGKADKTKAKPSKPAKKKSQIDSAELTLRILGAVFLVAGIYFRFVYRLDGVRLPMVSIICFVIGGSMLKAGFPSEDDWKDDFK